MSLPTISPAPLAVSYLRVSTKDQASRGGLAEGLSLPAQRSAIKAKADAVGAVIVAEFADAGESGRSTDRPQLQEMLRYLREHHIDIVLVHKIDRLARSRADDVTINLAIRQAGARLVSVTENVDETPQGQLVHGIFSAVADFYSQNLAQEVVKGLEQKVRGGGTPSRAPVGYLNVRNIVNGVEARQVAVDPDRADHIRWAFETYANDPDITLTRMTDLLADRGLTIRATAKQPERQLQRSHVHRLLTNRYYLGYTTFRGVEYPGSHEALVDAETFQRVQDRLNANRGGGNRERKHLHYLSGSLHCGNCGSRLVYSVNTGAQGVAYEYYMCLGRQTKTTNCTVPVLPVDKVEDAVERAWETEHAAWKTSALPAIRERLVEHLRSIRDASTRNTTALQRRIDKVQRDRYKWAENAMEGIVPADIAREKQAALARQLANLESELKALEAAGVDTETTLERVIDLISDPAHAYSGLEPGLRRTYNQAWFTKIYIDAVPDGPETPMQAVPERSDLADALEASRLVIAAELENETAGPEGPAVLCLPSIPRVRSLNKQPLVEHRRFELLTSSMRTKRATNCANAPGRSLYHWLSDPPRDGTCPDSGRCPHCPGSRHPRLRHAPRSRRPPD